LNITLLSVQITSAPNKNGKLFQTADAAYKNNSFQGKVEGKKVTQYNEAAFKVLADPSSIGKTFEVEIEKKDGFNNWVSMKQVGAGDVAQQTAQYAPHPAGVKGAATSTPVRSTYETPEERAIKQVYIVRQSSLTNAINTLGVGAKKLEPADVLKLAQEYTDFVFGKKSPGASGFEDFPDVPDEFVKPE
jgi:hypothetical protein